MATKTGQSISIKAGSRTRVGNETAVTTIEIESRISTQKREGAKEGTLASLRDIKLNFDAISFKTSLDQENT
ncbi:MAG: hypothetical protein DWQ04_05905 [Chloroflexi bacterium]|nr:MAG: hypothetical protein DWQ04_05905 [Chloroflexota bacterium]